MKTIINNFVKNSSSITLQEVADITKTKLVLPTGVSDTSVVITDVAALKESDVGSISFFNNKHYIDDFMSTKATACFVDESNVEKAPKGLILFVGKDPYGAFALISQNFYKIPKFEGFISDKAAIDPSAKLGKDVFIAPFAVIGKDVVVGNNTYIAPNVVLSDGVIIGNNCYIHSNSSIKYAEIGDNCIFHEGVRIGQDGFGFAPNANGHIKIPQIAKVIIGNNVEIGSNTCVDRGSINNTEILEGTKIDNLVQIAHGVRIGRHCFLAAKVGIAGSCIIEDFVSIGGNAGIAPHVTIGSGAQIAPMSGVSGNIEAKAVVIGIPAVNFTTFWRTQAILKRLLKK